MLSGNLFAFFRFLCYNILNHSRKWWKKWSILVLRFITTVIVSTMTLGLGRPTPKMSMVATAIGKLGKASAAPAKKRSGRYWKLSLFCFRCYSASARCCRAWLSPGQSLEFSFEPHWYPKAQHRCFYFKESVLGPIYYYLFIN